MSPEASSGALQTGLRACALGMGLGLGPCVGTVYKHVASEAKGATRLVGRSGAAWIFSDLVGPPTEVHEASDSSAVGMRAAVVSRLLRAHRMPAMETARGELPNVWGKATFGATVVVVVDWGFPTSQASTYALAELRKGCGGEGLGPP